MPKLCLAQLQIKESSPSVTAITKFKDLTVSKVIEPCSGESDPISVNEFVSKIEPQKPGIGQTRIRWQ